MGRNLLGITLKFPEPGKVKTRLAKDLGDLRAARVCREIAEHTVANTIPSGGVYERIFFFSPSDRKKEFAAWLKDEILMPQRGSDIGEIMQHALADLFMNGAGKAVIVGADIPELNRQIITEAFGKLDSSDIVIGPATDGGYYLIGMRTLHPDIFQSIPWSTDMVFRETVSRIHLLGLTMDSVGTLSDVDNAEDLSRLSDVLPDL